MTPRSRRRTASGPADGRPGRTICPRIWQRAIGRRLAGDRRVRIDLDLQGIHDFERDVWRKTLEIPRGEVRPYGWIAAEIGRPRAVRAVGTALGHNPVPLVVPCHRVVRSDGMIGQYSLGGPQNKRTILAAEGLDPDVLETQARAGIRYLGSDTTRIVCLPTCHNARRITRGTPRGVPIDASRGGRRLPSRAASAGRSLVPWPPDPTRRCPCRHPNRPSVHSDLGPFTYANTPGSRSRRSLDLGRDADPVPRLGLDLPWHRGRGRHDPPVPDGREPVPHRGPDPVRPGPLRGQDAGSGGQLLASGETARSSGRSCSGAAWAWSRSASRPWPQGSPPCSSP